MQTLYDMIQALEARVEALENKHQQAQESCDIDSLCLSMLPQSQKSLSCQLLELIAVASRCGLYDAADFMKRFVTTAQARPDPER